MENQNPMDLVAKIADAQFASKPKNEEDPVAREARLKFEGEILAVIRTDGGKALVRKLEELKEKYVLAPEQYLRTNQLTNQVDVDTTLVAAYAGAREAMTALLNFFVRCEKNIQAEAARREKKDSKTKA
jgi:hypothetical protein